MIQMKEKILCSRLMLPFKERMVKFINCQIAKLLARLSRKAGQAKRQLLNCYMAVLLYC